MQLKCPDARLHQKPALTGAEIEHVAGCYMHVLQMGVCSLECDPLPSAFAGAILHLEAKPARPAHAKLKLPAMMNKHATQINQSALGYVLADAATAQRLSEVVPGCVAAKSLQAGVGDAVL